jgi:cellulose synthase/poly-beta-1,6-N-acetylglucosamine synthase-like glycosyltransferase
MISLVFWLSVFFVAYTYAGYPLLISFLSKFKRRDVQFSENFEPRVTLIIAAYNEETVIEKKIGNSLDLDYPFEKLQILVAADGSFDSTPEIVRKFSDFGVELNHVIERSGKIVAMNHAIGKATGEVVVFSDANNMYEHDALRKLIAPFSDPSVGASTGAKLIVQDGSDLGSAEGIYWKYESWI